MTWGRAALCWLAALLLAAIYVAGESAPPSPTAVPSADARTTTTPVPAHERAYTLDADVLRTVELRRGDDKVVLERVGGGWAVKHPTDRAIPGGLVQAFVEQLVDGGEAERVADDGANPAFGFAEPQLRVTATAAEGTTFTLLVGAATPTGTAAYGRIEEQGAVVLVGRNLLYYADLLLD